MAFLWRKCWFCHQVHQRFDSSEWSSCQKRRISFNSANASEMRHTYSYNEPYDPSWYVPTLSYRRLRIQNAQYCADKWHWRQHQQIIKLMSRTRTKILSENPWNRPSPALTFKNVRNCVTDPEMTDWASKWFIPSSPPRVLCHYTCHVYHHGWTK